MEEAAGRARKFLQLSGLTGRDLREALNLLSWAQRRESKAYETVVALVPGDAEVAARAKNSNLALTKVAENLADGLDSFYGQLCKLQGKSPSSLPALTAEEERALSRVPLRNPNFPGPISMDYVSEKLAEQGKNYAGSITGLALYELNAFIDGELNVLEIRNAVSAECGPVPLRDVARYLEILEDVGLVSYRD
jgi:hypothetical protein